MQGDLEQVPDVREYLAVERTLLAYIRTGLAMMGFGFVLARLGGTEFSAGRGSMWFGVGLVFFGVLLNVLSVFEYRGLIARLNRARAANWPPARMAVGTAALTAIGGAVLGMYIVLFP